MLGDLEDVLEKLLESYGETGQIYSFDFIHESFLAFFFAPHASSRNPPRRRPKGGGGEASLKRSH